MSDAYSTSDLDRDFDKLVDGELSASQRRALLSALDQTPDGWRRCALAFLEAQTWREEARRLVETPPQPLAAPAESAGGRWRRVVPTAMAMAASFLLAFVLGLALRTGNPVQPLVADRGQSTVAVSPPSAMQSAPPSHIAQLPVAIRHSNAPSVETIWLPASVDSSDAEADSSLELARDLARLGHQIERQVELWPVEFEDGRRAVLPVDRFDVRYVGYEYQ